MVILDFIFKAILGIFFFAACAVLIGLIDAILGKCEKQIPPLLFNICIWTLVFLGGWIFCYGIGDLIVEVFFR